MLQQTQVATVIPYYARFLERYPDIAALAAAPLAAVLGAVVRARLLRARAQSAPLRAGDRRRPWRTVSACGRGDRAIARIGRSTAAAISAFAFGERAAILDGNVKRVLARCFGIEGFPGTAQTERQLWSLAESLLPPHAIEAYTQGLMDLGATLCTRSQPRCAHCPLAAMCVAQASGRQSELPLARPKRVVRERQTTLWLLSDGERVPARAAAAGRHLGAGLLCLPEAAAGEVGAVGEAKEAGTTIAAQAAEQLGDPAAFARRHGCRLLGTRALPPLKHSFTHFRLHIATLLCEVEVDALAVGEGGWQWLDYSAIGSAALPAPIRVLLESAAALAAPGGRDPA